MTNFMKAGEHRENNIKQKLGMDDNDCQRVGEAGRTAQEAIDLISKVLREVALGPVVERWRQEGFGFMSPRTDLTYVQATP